MFGDSKVATGTGFSFFIPLPDGSGTYFSPVVTGDSYPKYRDVTRLNAKHLYLSRTSLDSSVGITTGYGLDDRGVGVRVPVR
jgi:hypothetical protein